VRLIGDLDTLALELADARGDVVADEHEVRRKPELSPEAVGQLALAVNVTSPKISCQSAPGGLAVTKRIGPSVVRWSAWITKLGLS
jgi:hypothetical protein